MSKLAAQEAKILPAVVDAAEGLTTWLSKVQRPLVLTNGCFDILHRGHITYLTQAAELGKTLLVAVNDDESVRAQNKDSNRPINIQEDRMALLAALQVVDAVIPFPEPTPLELIQLIRPDVLVKGGDWAPDQIVGADEVVSWGGSVHSIKFTFERSTTALVERIRAN